MAWHINYKGWRIAHDPLGLWFVPLAQADGGQRRAARAGKGGKGDHQGADGEHDAVRY